MAADPVTVDPIEVVDRESAGASKMRAGVERVHATGERTLKVRIVHAALFCPGVTAHGVGVASALVLLGVGTNQVRIGCSLVLTEFLLVEFMRVGRACAVSGRLLGMGTDLVRVGRPQLVLPR